MQNMKLIPTSIPNLDAILGGGIPAYSLNIVAGQPGTGKTIMAQQILFGHIRPPAGVGEKQEEIKTLYITTLSEPALKVVRYMQHFAFFDSARFGEQVIYRDIGSFVRKHSLPEVIDHIISLADEHRPEIIVIDSFKAIRDLCLNLSDFRVFSHGLAVRLASARCTTFLVGEYDRAEIAEGAEFAVADGIIYLNIARQQGEERRFLQVVKMRGRAAKMASFPFIISENGVRILSPALTLRRREMGLETEEEQASTGILGLDGLLRSGIARGRSVILSGVSGTGKTALALQFLIHGAQEGEKGILFSFEETPGRVLASSQVRGRHPGVGPETEAGRGHTAAYVRLSRPGGPDAARSTNYRPSHRGSHVPRRTGVGYSRCSRDVTRIPKGFRRYGPGRIDPARIRRVPAALDLWRWRAGRVTDRKQPTHRQL